MFSVVDAASELPVAITMETDSRNDTKAFTPLIEEFDDRYNFEDIQAVLAGAGFDRSVRYWPENESGGRLRRRSGR